MSPLVGASAQPTYYCACTCNSLPPDPARAGKAIGDELPALQVVGRGSGNTAARSIAYRTALQIAAHHAGAELEGYAGRTYDYRHKTEVCHVEVLAPEGTPDHLLTPQGLANAIDRRETRKDAQLFRDLTASLPLQLDREANIDAVRSHLNKEFVARGMVVCWAYHENEGNPHFHAAVSMRSIDPEHPTGFGNKCRDWNNRELAMEWRTDWAEALNFAFERQGLDLRVSPLSLEGQRKMALDKGDLPLAMTLDREPEIHLGPAAHGLRQRGEGSELGDRLDAIQARNQQRREVYAEVARLPEPEQHRFLDLRDQVGDALKAWGAFKERMNELARDVASWGRDRIEKLGQALEAGLAKVDRSGLDRAREEARALRLGLALSRADGTGLIMARVERQRMDQAASRDRQRGRGRDRGRGVDLEL